MDKKIIIPLKKVFYKLGLISDFIIKTEKRGDWDCEIKKSGTAECTSILTGTGSGTVNQEGALYWVSRNKAYPQGFFESEPKVTVTVKGNWIGGAQNSNTSSKDAWFGYVWGATSNVAALSVIIKAVGKIGGGYYLEYSFIKGWCLYEIIHYPKKNNTNNVKQKEFILLPKRNGGGNKECDIYSMHLNRTAKGNLFSSCRGRFEHWKLICTCSRFVAHSKSHKARFQTRQRYNAKWWWLQLLGFDRSDGRRSINRLEKLWVSSRGMELQREYCGNKTCKITERWCCHA